MSKTRPRFCPHKQTDMCYTCVAMLHSTGVHSTGVHSMGVHSMGVHSMGVHSMGVHSTRVHSCGEAAGTPPRSSFRQVHPRSRLGSRLPRSPLLPALEHGPRKVPAPAPQLLSLRPEAKQQEESSPSPGGRGAHCAVPAPEIPVGSGRV